MFVSFRDDKEKNSKNAWLESRFFDDRQSDLIIQKANFPENTLCYVNQGWRKSNLFRICGFWAGYACC